MTKKELEEKIYNGETLSESELENAVFNLDEIDVKYDDNRRWNRNVSTIIKIKDKLFCINWSQGLTEYQDNDFYEQPFEVEEKTKTIVKKYYVPKNK